MPHKTFAQAAWQIVMADVSMSLDNVLAVAGAARDHPTALVFGLGLSIVLMGVAASFIARLLNRHRWIAYVGLAIILYVACDMIWRGALEVQPHVVGSARSRISPAPRPSAGEGVRPEVNTIRGGGGGAAARRGAHQVGDAARDRRRRIEPFDRPGRHGAEAVDQQRIMRAGEHHGVGAAAVRIDEAGGDLGLDGGIDDGRAGELGLGEGGEPRRADQHHIAAGGEFADQRAGIFAADGRLRAEHGDALALRLRAGRLDRRHGADEGHGKARAQFGERQRGGGVAGHHHQIGRVVGDRLADDIDDARDQRVFRHVAVGKAGIVGDIDEARVGPRRGDLAEHGEPADAGIEDEDGRGRRHVRP